MLSNEVIPVDLAIPTEVCATKSFVRGANSGHVFFNAIVVIATQTVVRNKNRRVNLFASRLGDRAFESFIRNWQTNRKSNNSKTGNTHADSPINPMW